MRLSIARRDNLWIWFCAAVAALFAVFFWLSTLSQPLIDQYEVRQTQTALSAHFMQPGVAGIVNYVTPWLGAPWSVPMEFPLYQWMVHHLARLTSLSLGTSGRLVSVLFGLGCVWPATRLMRHAGLGRSSVGLFILLYFTSSIYLYWNRAFLVESTALFFTLVSLDLYSRLRDKPSFQGRVKGLFISGFMISLSLGLLVKATTALPVLVLMGADWIWRSGSRLKTRRGLLLHLLLGVVMVISFLLLFHWTRHADTLKQLHPNPHAQAWTSSALRQWYFGEVAQRLQKPLWVTVVFRRMLGGFGSLPALVVIVLGLRFIDKEGRSFLIACLVLAFAPLLMFTPLHVIHHYYQAANQIYLLMAISASAGAVIDSNSCHMLCRPLVIFALSIIVTSSLALFFRYDWPSARMLTSQSLRIGQMIKTHTPANSVIAIYGDDNDWGRNFAYHSLRRAYFHADSGSGAISFPQFLRDVPYRLGGLPLGAVVSRHSIGSFSLESICKSARKETVDGINLYFCRVRP